MSQNHREQNENNSSYPDKNGFRTPSCPKPPEKEQTHVHEFLGSAKLAELEEDPHNHRFAGVSGEAIPEGKDHVHKVFTNTDFYEDHHHEVIAVSGRSIDVGNGRHVHFVMSNTTVNDGHFHELQFASLIESPISD